jgi:hypothetical protein
MSKITVRKNPAITEAGDGEGLLEGRFVSIAGSSIVVEDEQNTRTSYALAPDALLMCDGKIGNEETLELGRRIRITTQKGNPNLVTAVEWLHTLSSFPAPRSAADS